MNDDDSEEATCTDAWNDSGYNGQGKKPAEHCYRPQRSCGQGNVFTAMCDSVYGGGGLPQCMLGYHPPKETSQEGDPQGDPPPRRPPQEGGNPQGDPPKKETPQEGDPPRRRPPKKETPQEGDPPRRRPPKKKPPPGPHARGKLTGMRSRPTPKGEIEGDQIPPQEADSMILSMSGRYASYWNAFLFYYRMA